MEDEASERNQQGEKQIDRFWLFILLISALGRTFYRKKFMTNIKVVLLTSGNNFTTYFKQSVISAGSFLLMRRLNS